MAAKKPAPRNASPRPASKDPNTLRTLDAAYKLQKAGSLQQAELLYQKVLMAEPGNPFSLYALGSIALDRGDTANAVALFRQAWATGYTHETVSTHLGIALQSLGRLDEALEIYETASKLDPRNPRFHSNASVVLAQKGDYEGAFQMAQVAMKLNPKFAPAYMNAGMFLQSLGRPVEAVEMFERTLQLEPGNAEVHEALRLLKQKLAVESR
ncbi:MAG: tetratricopeptide repeat protein [Holophagaceae bacterium]|nr:tetratricopeptide repeat protein [Holophagaceae bacterium]